MSICSFHLARVPVSTTIGALLRPPSAASVAGLVHAECMTRMTLGALVVSPSRLQPRHLAMFASWKDEGSLDAFLAGTSLGGRLASGWHVRLEFLRQWGQLEALGEFPPPTNKDFTDGPVVAVTIARMKLMHVPRFIRWGRPVEALVRDHPGKTLALAAIRFPRTVSTFSIWNSKLEMTAMVHGHSQMPQPDRHSRAMVERERKNFHFEFTTLRFRPISEHGVWDGRRSLVPWEPS